MIYNIEDLQLETLINLTNFFGLACITAPKTRGRSNLKILILTKETIIDLSKKMKDLALSTGLKSFERDAGNILECETILLIGTRYKSLGLNCGYCGFLSCNDKEKDSNKPCVFNICDLGIAISSAVSLASLFHIDNRIMFTIGKAAIELNLFKDNEIKFALGVPFTAKIKNPFFDRKPI